MEIEIWSKKFLTRVHYDVSRVKIAKLLVSDWRMGYIKSFEEVIWIEKKDGKETILSDEKVIALCEKQKLCKLQNVSPFLLKYEIFEKNNEYKIKKMESKM
jgi:hypothetical protein